MAELPNSNCETFLPPRPERSGPKSLCGLTPWTAWQPAHPFSMKRRRPTETSPALGASNFGTSARRSGSVSLVVM